MKILIVKTSSLGDVIHCLPVINDIHAAFPNAQIDWIVEESFADIPRLHPAINQVYTVAFRRWRKHLLNTQTWSEIKQFKQLIASNQYDAVIDTQGLFKSAFITWLTNGVKHGYDKQSIREAIASHFYDKTYAISYQQHAVSRNRTLAALSLGYTAPTNAPDYGIQAKVDLNAIPSKPFLIALHGTSRDSKLWPTEHWINLGKALKNQQLNMMLPWSNAAELARAEEIAQSLENAVVLPKSNIAELASTISQAKAAIGVDTGLSHLSAALNIPTIAIYTDTNPALTGVVGSRAPVVNLGNIGEIPSVDSVLTHLSQIQTPSQIT
ncbi:MULTISPECIES: lipopolysaccharide heptosyltransferase I [Methylotenera]|uniref:lipopolysaccharide heptosyltransferase I n=1 Tax=Methylotenera TaxID=359407 RepID=UPI0003815781|nr:MULTISPECIES: lipopolysaccharide heptosyltransferase I [Methylotenera]